MSRIQQSFLQEAHGVLSPQQILRIQRSFTENIEFVQVWKDSGNNSAKCKLRGLTNTYVLYWNGDNNMTCSCPDFEKHHRDGLLCKHCCYAVLGKSLDGGDLNFFQQLIEGSRPVPLTANKFEVTDEDCVGEECPICYEDLKISKQCRKCPQCRKAFHGICLRRCLDSNARCPWCRATLQID